MVSLEMLPDERAFRNDVVEAPFALGECQLRWSLGTISWPFVHISISAAQRDVGPNAYWFRFDCRGYPTQAPTAQPWDVVAKQALPANKWPTGRSRVPAVFRPEWNNSKCLYIPCDRIAAVGHTAWAVDHPSLIWCPDKGIVLYLNAVHELLNSSDYTGARSE